MADHHVWLTDVQIARLHPLLSNKPRGVPRVDDRRVISGIIHVLKNGLMWRDAPSVYGPHKTLYNRFIRWSKVGVFNRIFATLVAMSEATDTVMIDATHLKAHRMAAFFAAPPLDPPVQTPAGRYARAGSDRANVRPDEPVTEVA